MFISPKTAIEEKWITHPRCKSYQDWINQKFVSPNAIDFTLDQLFRINNALFTINEQQKRMRGSTRLETITRPEGQFWELEQSCVYDGMSDMYVKVPDGVAALTVVRSTFNRNGIQINSGVYDSFFKGHIGITIYPRIGYTLIAPHTRISQIIFIESENVREYTGQYNHEQGTHWSED